MKWKSLQKNQNYKNEWVRVSYFLKEAKRKNYKIKMVEMSFGGDELLPVL